MTALDKAGLMAMTDAATIAKGLTKAQREAVVNGACESGYDGCVCDFVPLEDFEVMGIVPFGGTYLNKLGREIRAHLQETVR